MIIKLKQNIDKFFFDEKYCEEVFKGVVDIIGKDLGNKNYSLIKEYNKGTSFGIKKALVFGNTKLFIKIGEKVARENFIYDNQYFKNNKLFLNRIEKYSINTDVLVIPFYDGKNLDEMMFDEDLKINKKIDMIQTVLDNALDFFWLQNIKRGQNNLDWVEDYLMGRFVLLTNTISSIKIGNLSVTATSFFNLPIEYVVGRKTYLLPSINGMHQKVMSLFDNYKPQFTSCATVDFQPPNIIMGFDEFKHIDLSNSEIDGDIAIDIGKFFNFINRFYRVSFLRDNIKLGDSFKPRFEIIDRKLVLRVDLPNKNLFVNAIAQTEEDFCLKVASLTRDFNLINRVKLYKFVINSITLKRHLKYQELEDLLFFNLIDSYTEITDKIINI